MEIRDKIFRFAAGMPNETVKGIVDGWIETSGAVVCGRIRAGYINDDYVMNRFSVMVPVLRARAYDAESMPEEVGNIKFILPVAPDRSPVFEKWHPMCCCLV